MIEVTLYGRKECHLCDVVKEDLESLQETIPHRVIEVDIDHDTSLLKKYAHIIPVVKVGPYELKAPIDRQELQITLGAAQRGMEQDLSMDREMASAYRGALTWTKPDSFSYWLSKKYLLLMNLLVIVYVGLPFLAPVFMRAGAELPAGIIYRLYGMTCHQLAFRSWFLFGEQFVYPRAAAGEPGMTFGQVSGIDEEDIFASRAFTGSPQMGYKVALCERDVSIYGAIALFGLVFALTRRQIPGLPWYLWVLIGMVPIGVDGISQLISQPPFELIPYRESTTLFRTVTGGLFGLTTAWFAYPMVEETMAETRRVLGDKLARIQRHTNQEAKR
jgi:uncharacterized membrane protein